MLSTENDLAQPEGGAYAVPMNWDQLCDDPALENLPYRVEMAADSQLVLSPHRSYHSIFQSRIIRLLNQLLPEGEAMPECPINVGSGTVVADVAWATAAKVKRNFDLASWSESPELVVEVLSPSNARDEIRLKRVALFFRGAREFWVCDRQGNLEFIGPRGRLAKSRLCPLFPSCLPG